MINKANILYDSVFENLVPISPTVGREFEAATVVNRCTCRDLSSKFKPRVTGVNV